MTTSSAVGQKLWNYCNVLRDAGLSYGDYLGAAYLPPLSQDDARAQPAAVYAAAGLPATPPIPDGFDWPSLLDRDGDELETHYRRTLETLGRQPGTLGVIFKGARNEIQEPAMLTRLVKGPHR